MRGLLRTVRAKMWISGLKNKLMHFMQGVDSTEATASLMCKVKE